MGHPVISIRSFSAFTLSLIPSFLPGHAPHAKGDPAVRIMLRYDADRQRKRTAAKVACLINGAAS